MAKTIAIQNAILLKGVAVGNLSGDILMTWE